MAGRTCDSPTGDVPRQPVTCDRPDVLVSGSGAECDSAIATMSAAKCDSMATGPDARDAAAGTSGVTRTVVHATGDEPRAASGLTMRAARAARDAGTLRKAAHFTIGYDRRPATGMTSGDGLRSHIVTLDAAAGTASQELLKQRERKCVS